MRRILGEIQDGTSPRSGWRRTPTDARTTRRCVRPGSTSHREGRGRAPGHDAVRHRRQAEDPGHLGRLSRSDRAAARGARPGDRVLGRDRWPRRQVRRPRDRGEGGGLGPTFRHIEDPDVPSAAGQGGPRTPTAPPRRCGRSGWRSRLDPASISRLYARWDPGMVIRRARALQCPHVDLRGQR